MTEQNLSLFHNTRASSLKENAPLLIMLHGYGSDENDLFSFATELQEDFFIISVRAPYPMQPYGNAWYAIHFDAEQGKWSDNEQAIESRDKISRFIDEACNAYPVDKDNVTLLGFSQGTILSLATGLTYPNKIKNIVALSGYLNHDIFPKNLDPKDFKHLNIYNSHGSVDQVIPVDWARKTAPFIESLNINYKYNEFPVGHGVAPQNFYEFKNWLEDKI